MAEKVIISCAVTGAIHTPTMSPHLPVTPEQIAAQAIEAAEAGAAVLHLHARDPADGRPTPDPDVFLQFLPCIKAKTNAVINITTGGSIHMSLDDRLKGPLRLKPEMSSLNMGSMNFALHRMAGRYKEWKYDWELAHVLKSEGTIFPNTFLDIKRILKELGEGCGTRFEFECYDLGHLYNLAYLLDAGLVKPPLYVQSIFGILGGQGVDPENVVFARNTADRLLGRENYEWSVLGAGRHQMKLVTLGAVLGGNVRVGLEDSLYIGKGQLAKSNAEQVRKIRGILEALSLEIATPDDVRAMLHLKGKDNVAF